MNHFSNPKRACRVLCPFLKAQKIDENLFSINDRNCFNSRHSKKFNSDERNLPWHENTSQYICCCFIVGLSLQFLTKTVSPKRANWNSAVFRREKDYDTTQVYDLEPKDFIDFDTQLCFYVTKILFLLFDSHLDQKSSVFSFSISKYFNVCVFSRFMDLITIIRPWAYWRGMGFFPRR